MLLGRRSGTLHNFHTTASSKTNQEVVFLPKILYLLVHLAVFDMTWGMGYVRLHSLAGEAPHHHRSSAQKLHSQIRNDGIDGISKKARTCCRRRIHASRLILGSGHRGNAGGGEGGGGGMRTVECLRGRLQAERVASKAAKEEADQLATKLDELEKKLAEGVKIRNKAERRLRRAIKRLESLNILDVQQSPSETSIGSLSSNSTGCSGQQAPETNDSLTSTIDSVRSGPPASGEGKGWDGESAKGSSAGSCTTQANSSHDGSWFSVVSEQSGSGLCREESRVVPDDAKSCRGASGDSAAGDVANDSQRESEQPAASSGSGSSKSEASYRDEEDDKLALVLVDNPHYVAESGRHEDNTRYSENEEREVESNKLAMVLADPQPQHDAPVMSGGTDVQSVLLALRQVKEQLRYTIERRSEGLVAHRELYGH